MQKHILNANTSMGQRMLFQFMKISSYCVGWAWKPFITDATFGMTCGSFQDFMHLMWSCVWLNWGSINSWAPERFQFNFRYVIFKLNLVNGGWGISYVIALRWTPLDLTDDESTLVQVMAWCRQATTHYLSQCWPRSISPNGVTGPQCV